MTLSNKTSRRNCQSSFRWSIPENTIFHRLYSGNLVIELETQVQIFNKAYFLSSLPRRRWYEIQPKVEGSFPITSRGRCYGNHSCCRCDGTKSSYEQHCGLQPLRRPAIVRRLRRAKVERRPDSDHGLEQLELLRIGANVSQIEGEAQALISTGLSSVGYVYINVDDGWYECPGPQGPNVDQSRPVGNQLDQLPR